MNKLYRWMDGAIVEIEVVKVTALGVNVIGSKASEFLDVLTPALGGARSELFLPFRAFWDRDDAIRDAVRSAVAKAEACEARLREAEDALRLVECYANTHGVTV